MPMATSIPPFQPLILWVDNEDNDVLLLKRAFEKAGLKYPIFRVRSGFEAQAYLCGHPPFQERARHPFPCLVLLDIRMPQMDGFEVLEWIRRQPDFTSLPVAMLTGSSEKRDANLSRELGANCLLVKPTDLSNAAEISRSLEMLIRRP
jgi:CheY-like chemotaxis protein